MTIAPGPRLRVIAQLSEMRRDPLGYMQRSHRQYGDIVRLGGGSATVHLLGHPDHADHVLRKAHHRYDRDTRSADAMKLVTGESILTTSGEPWRTRRLLLQPTFNHDAVAPLASLILDETSRSLQRWKTVSSGTIDASREMSELTLAIASRAFFGTQLGEEEREMCELIPPVIQRTYERSTSIIPLYRIFKTSRDRRFDRQISRLHHVVRMIIAQNLVRRGELLTRLFDARFEDGTSRLSQEEVANETLALLLAGHETTANTLTWALYYLTRDRDVLAQMREELDQAAPDGKVTADIFPRLPMLSAVVSETMRLAPSVWIVERRAMDDDEIGGCKIEKDSIVYVSPWILHRHPDFWEEPESFNPSRFIGVSGRNPAYIPFGAGPHHCLGSHFALLEAKLILASIVQSFDLKAVSDAAVSPHAWITLRPSSRIEIKVSES